MQLYDFNRLRAQRESRPSLVAPLYMEWNQSSHYLSPPSLSESSPDFQNLFDGVMGDKVIVQDSVISSLFSFFDMLNEWPGNQSGLNSKATARSDASILVVG